MAAVRPYDERYFINCDSCNDLQLYEIGYQACPPSYSYGPIIRDHYIFHYLFSGKGMLTIDDQDYPVYAHQGFIIPPNALAYYIADEEDPWHYVWIHLDGPQAAEHFEAAGLHKTSPVFRPSKYPNEADAIMRAFLANPDRPLYCIGKAYELFDCLKRLTTCNLIPSTNLKLSYIKKIIGFIHVKYSDPFRMEDLANACGLERSYMTKLFKHATGSTPKEYLNTYRMKQARMMLEKGDVSIQHIAYAVGYGDTFTFSKAFKRTVGMSPSEYRLLHKT